MKIFYCPFCNNRIEVMEIGVEINTCECDKCGNIMLESNEKL